MRSLLILLTPALLIAQAGGVVAVPRPAPAPQYRPEDLGSIAGQVINSVTGEPVRKGILQLLRVASAGSGAMAYSAQSDPSGKFVFPKVGPGNYRLSFNRAGFASSTYSGGGTNTSAATLTLNRAQNISDIVLRAVPNGVITGRVVDEDGDPAAYAPVQILRYRYVLGRRVQTTAATATSNDLGEFRLFDIPAGKYRLSVTPSQRYATAVPIGQAAESLSGSEEYVPTYYPGVTDASAAAELEVAAGAQIQNVIVRLVKTRTVHVRGRVSLTVQETPQPNVSVSLTPVESMSSGRSSSADRQGNFDIKSVVPGSYTLSVNVLRNSKPPYSTQIALPVGSGGVDGLAITVPPPIELTGTVRADGNEPIALKNVRISFIANSSVGAGNRAFTVTANESGAFRVENVNPDRYTVSAAGAPGNRYLKAVRAGGVDALANGLDLSGGSPGLIEIVLGSNAGIITGSVQGGNSGQAFAGATAVLAPQEKERRAQSVYYKTTVSGGEGRFTFSGIPPGSYKLFAWEQTGDDFNYLDPDYTKPVESKGQAVTVREGDSLELQITAIPAGSQR